MKKTTIFLMVGLALACINTHLLAVPVDITFTEDGVIQEGDDYAEVFVYGDTTTVDMSGSEVYKINNYDQSITNIRGGLVAHALIYEQSTINISGGVVHEAIIFSASGGTINITGGECWRVFVSRGELNISGGQIRFYIDCGIGVVNVYGYGFEYDSQHSPNLTGFWADGTPFGLDFIAYDRVVLHEIPPLTPPVADADGPYSIFVGDTLTLDASGSTDDDNDIVSYMWDLDDNNSFETDAGGQAIFDVNYTYLHSLGLLINYTYTIHLKVTDSEDQNDTNDTTLTILPKPALEVDVDIKPGSCPNPVNVKSSGILPIAILGTDDLDVTTIDPTSIRLAGVEPLRNSLEDVAGPVSDSNDCNCITDGPDGFLDLTLKFKTQRIVEAVGDVNDGDVRALTLTGVLSDETPIEGADCIVIRGKAKSLHGADINKDGVVDMADFAIFAQNWLQSSIVDE